ncbi:MAG: M48 family metallopeptidase [Planctomycetota bacterium]
MLLTYIVSLLIIYLPISAPQNAAVQWWAPLGVLGVFVLNAFACWMGVRSARRMGDRKGDGMRVVRIFKMLKLGIVGFVFLDVVAFNWPTYVMNLFEGRRGVPVIPDLLLILPVLLMIGTLWAFRYRYQRSEQTASGPDGFSMVGYIMFRFRMELAILIIPWFLLVLGSDVTALIWGNSPQHVWIDGGVSLGIIILLVTLGPAALSYIWRTSPLPEGELRERLETIAHQNNFHCRDILIWHTRKHIPNAAVIGPLPFMRYVLVTDALWENCTKDEIAGIFAHEVGHVVHHHMRFYFIFAILYGVMFVNLSQGLSLLGWGGPVAGLLSTSGESLTGIVMLIYTLGYWIFGFGYVSRRMERQADLFALGSCEKQDSLIHGLTKLSMLSGRPAEAGSWRHFSIARRTQFLRRVIEEPQLGEKTRKTAYVLRMCVGCVFVINVFLAVVFW